MHRSRLIYALVAIFLTLGIVLLGLCTWWVMDAIRERNISNQILARNAKGPKRSVKTPPVLPSAFPNLILASHHDGASPGCV